MNQQRTAILKQVPGKSTPRLNTLTASELVEAIASRQITSESVVRDCLARIEEREEDVQAWSYIDEELVLRQARECDEAEVRGPLHGLPVGIKDIIDTCDMPTGMGSPIYRDHQPEIDAACVSILRAAGAVIMGKTVTAEFAGAAPGATRNPHNLAHTPGGSSSGSAAAVADYMVPVALGTQTGGSVHRPSAFCGTVGFKPTFGTFSRKGIKLAAESLDTIGIHARTVADCELMTAVLAGNLAVGRPEISKTPRIGLCRTYGRTRLTDVATGPPTGDEPLFFGGVRRVGRCAARAGA